MATVFLHGQTGTSLLSQKVVIVSSLFDYPNTVALSGISINATVVLDTSDTWMGEGTYNYKRYTVEKDGSYRIRMQMTPYYSNKSYGWYGSTIGRVRVNDKVVFTNDNYNSSNTQYTNTVTLKKGDVIDFGACAYARKVNTRNQTFTHSVTVDYTVDYAAFVNITEVPNLFAPS